MRRRFLASAMIAGLSFVLLLAVREYPWQLALLASLAIGALFYVVLRTIAQLRALSKAYGKPDRWSVDTDDPPDAPSAS